MISELPTERLKSCRRFLTVLMLGCVLLGQLANAASVPARELLIGIEPEHNIFDQVERYRILAEYLSRELGLSVRLTVMSRYGEVLQRFKTRHLDGAFLSSYPAAMAIKQLNLEPAVMSVNLEGNASCLGYILARQDSGIKTVSDMKGKSMVFVDPASTEGYLFPLSLLRKNGIKDEDGFFSRHSFVGSHASAIFAVLDGKADMGSAKSTVFNRLTAKDPTINSELRVIAESQAFPETTLCIRRDLPEDVKQNLTGILLAMAGAEGGREILHKMKLFKFVKATPSDFDGIANMLDLLNQP